MIEMKYMCNICMTVHEQRGEAYDCCDGSDTAPVYICVNCGDTHSCETAAMNCCVPALVCRPGEIPINASIVATIINAFIGPPYLIRELQAIYKPYIPDNPVSKLIAAYNDGAARYNQYMEAQNDKSARHILAEETADTSRAEAHVGESAQRIPREEGQNKRDV